MLGPSRRHGTRIVLAPLAMIVVAVVGALPALASSSPSSETSPVRRPGAPATRCARRPRRRPARAVRRRGDRLLRPRLGRGDRPRRRGRPGRADHRLGAGKRKRGGTGRFGPADRHGPGGRRRPRARPSGGDAGSGRAGPDHGGCVLQPEPALARRRRRSCRGSRWHCRRSCSDSCSRGWLRARSIGPRTPVERRRGHRRDGASRWLWGSRPRPCLASSPCSASRSGSGCCSRYSSSH